MAKVLVVDGIKVHLRSGVRDGRAVVACTLIFPSGAPIRDMTLDKLMANPQEAAQFVEAADEHTAQQIVNDIQRSEGHIIEAINRVFSAPASQVATRVHQLERRRTR